MPHPDSDALVALLPHRPPFRFVDVGRRRSFPRAHRGARYRVTGDEDFLAGHFPGNPVVPRRASSSKRSRRPARSRCSCDERYAGKLALFGGVEKVRFRRIVRPGDELLLVVEIERLSARGGWAQARASVDGETACEARMFFAVT